jgi:hypothetical protein
MAIWLLDEDGQARLIAWAVSAEPDDLNLVHQVLDDVAWGRAWSERWHTTPDVFARHDHVIRPRRGLRMIVRLYADGPESFSILDIAEEPFPKDV